MVEIWKDIPEFKGFYQVSNIGRVKSLDRVDSNGRKRPMKILQLNPDSDGYLIVGLHKNGKCKTAKIHRLVAEAFIQNPNRYKEVNHKDENKKNNSVENLEWCTTQYNLTYGHRLECAKGENNHLHKLTKEQVIEIRRMYKKGDPQLGQSALGRKYGVAHGSIAWIVNRKSWKHIKEE